MADQKSISPENLDRATTLLMQVSELADTINKIAVNLITEAPADHPVHTYVAIRELAAQAGMLTDACSESLDGITLYGGNAERWLVSPIARRDETDFGSR